MVKTDISGECHHTKYIRIVGRMLVTIGNHAPNATSHLVIPDRHTHKHITLVAYVFQHVQTPSFPFYHFHTIPEHANVNSVREIVCV